MTTGPAEQRVRQKTRGVSLWLAMPASVPAFVWKNVGKDADVAGLEAHSTGGIGAARDEMAGLMG